MVARRKDQLIYTEEEDEEKKCMFIINFIDKDNQLEY